MNESELPAAAREPIVPEQQPQGPRYVFIGFNFTIDRQSITRLMQAVGLVMERKPRPQAIVLCISSEGGMIEQAFYAYELLRALPVGVGTYNVGLVASAANILFMAGNVRMAAPGTSFLFHDARFPLPGPGVMRQDELALTVQSIRQSDIRSADIIADRIGKPVKEVKRWFGEKLRTADFALKHGVIGEITPVRIGHPDEFLQVVL
jgi:ATP-dependent protease ClpP protease subunit